MLVGVAGGRPTVAGSKSSSGGGWDMGDLRRAGQGSATCITNGDPARQSAGADTVGPGRGRDDGTSITRARTKALPPSPLVAAVRPVSTLKTGPAGCPNPCSATRTKGVSMITRLAPGSFYGQAQSSFTFAGMTFLESVYPPALHIPPHAHSHAFFCLVLEGASTETYEKRSRTNEPFTLVFHPAEEVHSNRWHGPGGRTFHVEITAPTLERLRDRAPVLNGPADFRGSPPVRLALRLYQEYCRMDDLSPLAMEGLALELLAEASRRPAPVARHRPPRWLSRVTDILRGRFAEKLSLGDLAATACISPDHLARVSGPPRLHRR